MNNNNKSIYKYLQILLFFHLFFESMAYSTLTQQEEQ